MEILGRPVIYSIGHSVHSIEFFLDMLKSFDIEMLIDIRRFPGSRKYPWFNKESLEDVLSENNIGYIHLEELGGRRKVRPDSVNNRWQNISFQGYADYMQTTEFETGVKKLQKTALKNITAFMCSEALWWRCHRSMVSDYLKAKGWNVIHIMGIGKVEEHHYTSPARIINGNVLYSD